MTRLVIITQNEFYHLYNRGNNKQIIFRDEKDYARFLFLLLYFQSPHILNNVGRLLGNANKTVQYRVLNKLFNQNIEEKMQQKITEDRYVELISFALMPNHFHVLIYEKKKGGISKYMQRVLLAYTKYFNTKYDQSGHLFQGPYKAVHQRSEKQLIYTSAYIHRNPYELKEWRRKEHKYPWSSYQDYVSKNRWGDLLKTKIILGDHGTGARYKKYVTGTKIKEFIELK